MKITKNTVKFIVSVIVLFCGLAMGFCGMFLPPVGQIDPTVLTFVGEVLTFVGAVWGIGQYSSIQIAKINRSSQERQNSES